MSSFDMKTERPKEAWFIEKMSHRQMLLVFHFFSFYGFLAGFEVVIAHVTRTTRKMIAILSYLRGGLTALP